MRPLLALALVLACAHAFAQPGDAGVDAVVPDASAQDASAEDAGPRDPASSRFDGHYQLTDVEEARAASRTAVADAVRGLNPGIRQVFSTELGRVLAAPRNIVIDATSAESTIKITLDGHALSAPRSGAPRAQTGLSGRRETVVHRFLGSALIQESRTENGVRTSAFTLDAAGTLVVTTRFSTPLLPRQVEAVARYRRATP